MHDNCLLDDARNGKIPASELFSILAARQRIYGKSLLKEMNNNMSPQYEDSATVEENNQIWKTANIDKKCICYRETKFCYCKVCKHRLEGRAFRICYKHPGYKSVFDNHICLYCGASARHMVEAWVVNATMHSYETLSDSFEYQDSIINSIQNLQNAFETKLRIIDNSMPVETQKQHITEGCNIVVQNLPCICNRITKCCYCKKCNQHIPGRAFRRCFQHPQATSQDNNYNCPNCGSHTSLLREIWKLPEKQ